MTSNYKPGLRVSEYLLEERIGVGSFCEVWRARHHIWDSEHVAAKLPIDAEYVRYLQREGLVVHGIRHANVVRVLGLDPYADVPYLIMELVRGPSLGAVLDEHKQGLPVDVALTVFRGLLNALVAAHGANVLHRDIKPGNILLNLAGKPLSQLAIDDVKIGDFGLGLKAADSLRSIAQSASLERDNELVGTIAYMAPEIKNSERDADARADLYSAGVVLFEMLTGERPAGAELPSTMRAGLPAWADSIFQRLYSRYERRLESAAAVLAQLPSSGAIAPRVTSPPPLPTGKLGIPIEHAPTLARTPKAAVGEDVPCPSCRVSLRAHSGLTNCPVCQATLDPAFFAALPSVPPPPPARTTPVTGVACKRCANRIDDGDQFCTQCGEQLVPQVRRCSTCGFWPSVHDAFCTSCGTRLP
ncbi:MAG: serine/threonine-protein kinase [Phycisphaerae bacterium]